MTKTLMLTLTAACLLAPALGTAQEPLQRTKAFIETLKTVQSPAKGAALSAAIQRSNSAIFGKLDGFLDFDAMATSAMAPHRAKLTAEQMTRFTATFKRLIRLISYPDSGAFLRKTTLVYGAAKGKAVTVQASLEAEDIDTEITFHWSKRGAAMKVVDVSFDDDSLIEDYQNQFGRLIKKKGVDGLLKLLDDRLAKEVKKRGALE